MPGHKGTIIVHGSRKIALECEEGDAAYAELVCATEALKFKSAIDTKMIDFVPGDSSKQFSISANLDPK